MSPEDGGGGWHCAMVRKLFSGVWWWAGDAGDGLVSRKNEVKIARGGISWEAEYS